MPQKHRIDQRIARRKRQFALDRDELRTDAPDKPQPLSDELIAKAKREGRYTRLPPKRKVD